jgi:hypothetical protein
MEDCTIRRGYLRMCLPEAASLASGVLPVGFCYLRRVLSLSASKIVNNSVNLHTKCRMPEQLTAPPLILKGLP